MAISSKDQRRAQRTFENKLCKMIGVTKFAVNFCTQKIDVETSKNNCWIEIGQRRHKGKWLVLEELRSLWEFSITSHESYCQYETANSKFMISEVISVLCIQINRKLAKQEKKSFRKVQAKHLLKVFRAPERCIGIWKCWIHGQICGKRWWKKKQGSRSRNPRKDSKRACLQRGGSFPRFGFHSPSVSKACLPYSFKWKLV